MGGIEFVDGTLIVGREANELDHLAIRLSSILDHMAIDHVFVSGYVAILAGRARSTEAIDVLLEPIDEETAKRLVTDLRSAGFWGPAMPLEDLYLMLSEGDNIWVAPDQQVSPHLELKVVDDEFDRAALENAITARIEDASLPVGPFELQIAYKLYLGSRQDFEDAVHLYSLFGDTLNSERLES